MKTTPLNSNRSKGFALIELMVAVIIVSLLGLAAFKYYQIITSDTSIDQERDNISQYVPRAFSQIASYADTSSVTTQMLINNRVFKFGVSGNSVKNKFGGVVTVAPANTQFGTNDALAFTNTGYPGEACTGVIPKINSIAMSIKVNGTDVKTATTPLDTAALGTACLESNNTIVFTSAKT